MQERPFTPDEAATFAMLFRRMLNHGKINLVGNVLIFEDCSMGLNTYEVLAVQRFMQ